MGLQFRLRPINHVVVVNFARQQQRTRKGGTREPAKHFTDSSGVRPGVEVRPTPPQSERRVNRNSGQTRKSQNSVRPQRRRRLSRAVYATDGWQQRCAANMPTQVQRGCKRTQLCQKTPFSRKTLSTHMHSATRLLPTTLARFP